MIVKQEPEHSMFRRQHLVIFVIHGLLSTVPWNTLKLEKNKSHIIYGSLIIIIIIIIFIIIIIIIIIMFIIIIIITIISYYYYYYYYYYHLWITVVKMMEYCLKMMILRLYFSFLKLRLAVCGRVCRLCSIWFHLCQWKIGANGYDLCLRKSISDPGNMIFHQIL